MNLATKEIFLVPGRLIIRRLIILTLEGFLCQLRCRLDKTAGQTDNNLCLLVPLYYVQIVKNSKNSQVLKSHQPVDKNCMLVLHQSTRE